MAFNIPDTLPADAGELSTLRTEALDAFNELYEANQEPDQDTLDQMGALADLVERVDEKLTSIAAEEKEAEGRAHAAADLAARIHATKGEDDTDSADTGEVAGEEDTGEEKPAEEHREEEAEPVAASAQRKPRTEFSRAATGREPRDVPTVTRGWRLTTSAKNFETGVVDSLKVAQEFNALAHGRSARVLATNGRSETTLAYMDREVPDEFTIKDQGDTVTVLDHATDEARLDGGSLVAAGGWCAPSETIYSFLPVEAPSDLLSLPEVTLSRGGIKFPKEPNFADIYTKIGFHQTEAQAQAKTEKTCFEIPCGEFEELRLDVQGICITGGILQDKAWPELTKKYVDEALRLHAHKINAWRIGKIVEGSTQVTGITGTFGTAGAVLSTLELQVADMRAKHRLPSNRAVEGFAPVWLINVLRADLAYRDEVLPQQVTDEQVKAHFRNLGANLQFIGDWQNDVIGGAAEAKTWPTKVEVVLYPSGTWYSAVEQVVNLGVIYDAALLKTNQAIQMFTEDGVAVGKRGPESRRVEIPIAVNGEVGARHAGV